MSDEISSSLFSNIARLDTCRYYSIISYIYTRIMSTKVSIWILLSVVTDVQ